MTVTVSLAISSTFRGKRLWLRKSYVRVRDAYVVGQVVPDVSEDLRFFPGNSPIDTGSYPRKL